MHSWSTLEKGFALAAQVAAALQMRGGGTYEPVGPGQGTDDTELTLSLGQALLAAAPPFLPLESIARAYCSWRATSALDVGTHHKAIILQMLY